MNRVASQRTHLAVLLGAFAAGLVTVLLLLWFVMGKEGGPGAPAASGIGGPFQLVDQNGRPFTQEQLKGKPTLIFFGFTHCPDVCPTALFEISEIFGKLGPAADNARALFVTVDPERDTAGKLKDYLSSFDPRLGALTGDPAAIEAMLKAYRVYAKKVPLKEGDYTMDHTALVYLMDKQGRFVAPFNIKRKPEEAAAELRRYL